MIADHDHDIAVSMHGGPFDGELMLITARECRLPRSIPMPVTGDKLIHLYTLTINENDDFVDIRYVYDGCVESALYKRT